MAHESQVKLRTEDDILAVGVFGTLRTDQPYDDDLLRFYAGVYGRETEIPHMPGPTRHLTYESCMSNGYKTIFTGCEVNQLASIPAGMHGFEVTQDKLRIFSGSVERGPGAEAAIEWNWRHSFSAFDQVFVAGDFVAENFPLTEGIENLPEGPLLFCFSENTYDEYGSADYKEDQIILVEPDPLWPRKYQELKRWIRHELPQDLALRIEHYGSTAIPGIPAKPVIDILVEVPSFSILRSEIVPRLCSEDCSYGFFMNNATFCKRTSYRGERIAHIHMAPKDSPVWEGIQFRDSLLQNAGLASEYARLKRELASKYRDDRNHYTMGKAEFVNRVAAIMKAKMKESPEPNGGRATR